MATTNSTAGGSDGAIVKRGYVWKRSMVSGINWKRRLFELTDDTLRYYVETKGVPTGATLLAHAIEFACAAPLRIAHHPRIPHPLPPVRARPARAPPARTHARPYRARPCAQSRAAST
jgi:hypothetical protein